VQLLIYEASRLRPAVHIKHTTAHNGADVHRNRLKNYLKG